MKYINVFLFVVVSIYMFSVINYEEDIYVLPTDAIRLRVIANSNEANDQIIKYELVENISAIIESTQDENFTFEESKLAIQDAIPLIEEKLEDLGIEGTINYGYNYFPEKTYKSIVYEEGNYESLVVTIGSGLGENWWCVLFPPLCELDIEESLSDSEYSFYIKNIIEKYI